jgi:mannitol-1-phosphate 5-dehydrogenase
MKLVQFGAGRIGRSFLGQLFSAAGYEIVFVDADRRLVDALNRRRGYTIVVKDCGGAGRPGGSAGVNGCTPAALDHHQIRVENVRAVYADDRDAVTREVAEADIIGTSVGKETVLRLVPALADGLAARRAEGRGSVDIILAENLRGAAARVSEGLRAQLPRGFPIEEYVGLVETSIGKMCPIMPDDVVRADPTEVWCEAYNTLICDRRGFVHGVPDVPGLDPKDNMRAWVDRKSFIHNLGHAVCAYVGYQIEPVFDYVYQALHHPDVRKATIDAMRESAAALVAEYPSEFDMLALEEHIDDLIRRFGNEALGDTIHRVGRDLPRKLARDDRLVGAALLASRHSIDAPDIVTAIACGFLFRKPHPAGRLYEPDREFAARLEAEGPKAVLGSVCGLDPSDPTDAALRSRILEEYASRSARLPYDGGSEPARRPPTSARPTKGEPLH